MPEAPEPACATCGHDDGHAPMKVGGVVVQHDTYCWLCNNEHPFAPTEAPRGLHEKFTVFRNDGRDLEGGDKAGARYFVLDYIHDPIAQSALDYYAKLARNEGLIELADDLDQVLFDGRNAVGGGPVVVLAVDGVEARYEAHLRLERSKR